MDPHSWLPDEPEKQHMSPFFMHVYDSTFLIFFSIEIFSHHNDPSTI